MPPRHPPTPDFEERDYDNYNIDIFDVFLKKEKKRKKEILMCDNNKKK